MGPESDRQLSLDGFEPATATDRLFFALLPDAAAREAIAQLAMALPVQHALKAQPIDAQRLHVTLHYLGEYAGLPQEVLDRATAAAERVRTAPFEVVFDHAASFDTRNNRRPHVLRCGEDFAALASFRRALGEALVRQRWKLDAAADFIPHVTLLYDTQAVARQPVEPVRWIASDFALVRSLVGHGRHEVIGRWRLVG